jgi:lipid-binding SYLF domain-containing protein
MNSRMSIHSTIATITFALLASLAWLPGSAQAKTSDEYTETIERFKNAGESARFFKTSYAYAVFPTVGEGAFVVGGAFGKGRVYVHGRYVGDVTITKLSAGFQAGGKGFSEIIFFKDRRALEEFEKGDFEFGADISAVAITASASATAGTTGVSAGASTTANNAVTEGEYQKGMAVFTIAKGGLMYQAAVAGQKFHYAAR